MNDFFYKASRFVKEVEKFSNKRLKNPDDLITLLQQIYFFEKEKQFENLVFNAKYISGLKRIIIKSLNDTIKAKNINVSLNESYNKFTSDLKEMISNFDSEIKKIFEKKYLAPSTEAFNNLNNLISDFELTKIYMNELKRI